MKKILLYLFVLFFAAQSALAQSSSFISVSAIAALSNGSKVTCQALSFNKAVDCIQLNTGLSLFSGILGVMQFSAACKAITASVPLAFKLFPNPVVNYTRLISTASLPAVDQLQLAVIDAMGRIVMKRAIGSSNLTTGISLFFGNLSAGNYYLRIDGENLHRVVPFIKVK